MSAPTLRPPPTAAPDAAAPGALDLLEEAVHLLRQAPAGVLACYYGATLPFVLALLYFWADLSRDPQAENSTAEAALALSALFLVMKTGQAVFAERLRARLLGPGAEAGAPRWTAGRLARLFVVQGTLQPSGLFLLPLAALATLPLGWVYAFYQNVTALGDDAAGSPRVALARAGRAAMLAPRANHAALAILSMLGFVVWLDGMVAALVLPQLAKLFTGAENAFTRSGAAAIFNSTFLAVSFALAYAALDPLVKAFYVLRCFYADARRTGQDLRRELQALPTPRAATARGAVVAAALLLLGPLTPTWAEPSPAPAPPPATVAPRALDRSIDDVLGRREFTWRLPRDEQRREAARPKELSAFQRWWRRMNERIDRWVRWWRKLFERKDSDEKEEPAAPAAPRDFVRDLLQPLTYALIAAGVLAGLWMFWNARRRAAAAALAAGPEVSVAGPDPDAAELADESLLATRLPGDEWLRLGRELRERGESRLALRAFYLSILAHLAAQEWVHVARHKSNGDYLNETRRRARDRAGVADEFAAAVRLFERSWYGRHPADDLTLDALLARREAIVTETPASPAAAPVFLPS